ncbi:MAG: type II secretion system F family protein [Actinomycetes bacterium]
MTGFLLAALAAVGTYLLVHPADPRRPAGAAHRTTAAVQAARAPLALAGVVAATGTVAVGASPAVALAAVAAAGMPVWARKVVAERQRAAGQAAWPRMIEELRVLTGSVGRSVPQALFEVGQRAPSMLRPAFDMAQREWSLTGNFAEVVRLLKRELREPTADATLETLLVAHEVGGDLDRRLADLAADRRRDLGERQAARAAMAGARLARAFVVVVPAGMLLAGLGVGRGAAAYRTSEGALLVGVAVGMVAVCWWWAGSLMRVPPERRVLTS